ncbi:MAG: hypothetical protein E7513_05495 [Ruminococcaceae bacterium]|nr:hypothetical protein [Oscillospiraceae bacterium]
MKFCKECKKLYGGADIICTDCNKKYKEISDINEPVLLCVIGGLERNMVCGALKDAKIPFVETQYGPQGVSNEIVTGYDAKLLNIGILVPYSAIAKACDVIAAVGIDPRLDEEILQQVKDDIEAYKEKLKEDEDSQMSSSKRTTVKVISAIVFIILVALVVLGTDYVLELIKNLLGG